ncbi:MAG: DUF3857 and transglutaminase domain-containing protein [Chitinophagaceae bacterium]
MKKLQALLCLLLPALAALAQDPKIKFGKIKPEDLQTKVYALDSAAHTMLLSDVGKTEIVGNSKGWFSLKFQRHSRIHILNKNGYDAANIQIPLYTNGSATEKLNNLKGVTYNLADGKIVETKLDKSNVFEEKHSRNLVIKKFTLPNVKEGSIIDFTYEIESDFLTNLQPWTFQRSYPVLWSEYTVAIPQFLDYVFLSQGFVPFFSKGKKDRLGSYMVSDGTGAGATERSSFSCGVTEHRWAMKDIPELQEENFTSSIDNFRAKIEFQLAAFKDPLNYKSIMSTWQQVSKELLEDEDFGKNLSTANSWLGDVVKPLLVGAPSDLEKAQRIFAYMRDNITCTSHYGIHTSQPLKTIFKNKNGRVSEINLLLTAMLRYAGIDADPLILSTKENGFTYSMYPLLSRFNYLVSQVRIDGKTFMLDASHPRLGFGKLPSNCYNGHARLINQQAQFVDLHSDSLRERKVTSVYVSNGDKGIWSGALNQTMGYYESYSARQKINSSGKESFFNDIKKTYGSDVKITEPLIDSLTRLEDPISIHYNFDPNLAQEDILYISPMFGEGYRENPFKSAERFYPVEMPYASDDTYVATIQVPTGYQIDELPKPIKLKLNEAGEGYFEYLISQSADIISLRSKVKLQRTNFLPEEYEMLRAFFNLIVTKQQEQIVFKKKK